MSYNPYMRKNTITVRLPDGFELQILKHAEKRAKDTGKRPNKSEVILMAIKKFFRI